MSDYLILPAPTVILDDKTGKFIFTDTIQEVNSVDGKTIIHFKGGGFTYSPLSPREIHDRLFDLS